MAWSRGRSRHRLRATGTYEIDTDGGDVGLSVGVIGKSQQQARLSYTGITDKEKLEEIVVPGRSRLERVIGYRKRAS
jgi:hypothetical protein